MPGEQFVTIVSALPMDNTSNTAKDKVQNVLKVRLQFYLEVCCRHSGWCNCHWAGWSDPWVKGYTKYGPMVSWSVEKFVSDRN